MVLTDALEVDPLAIYVDAVVLVLDGADAEGSLIHVNLLIVGKETRHGDIHVRLLLRNRAPELRALHGRGHLGRLDLPSLDADARAGELCNLVSGLSSLGIELEDLGLDTNLGRLAVSGSVLNLDDEVQGRLALGDVLGGNESSVLADVGGVDLGEPDIAVDASTGVPPR